MSKRVLLVSIITASLAAGALLASGGQAQEGGSEQPVRPHPAPMLKYVMASPRACLIGPPVWSTNAFYLPSADAENFPRNSGTLRVRAGTRVIFSLSRELEGVWYTGTYGLLGTFLEMQWCRLCKCEVDNWKECVRAQCACERCKCLASKCEQCLCAAGDCPGCDCPDCKCVDCKCPEPDGTNASLCRWVTIGRDGARDVRKGPSVGRARVGVPVRFSRPGIYYLRGIIRTVAQPYYPRPLEYWQERLVDPDAIDKKLPRIWPAVDKDIVYVRVRVIELSAEEVEPQEPIAEDPDVANIKPMPKDVDANDIEPLSGDLNGDETVNLVDLAIFSQQWGREYEMPLVDDE